MTEEFKDRVRTLSHLSILITFLVALLITAKIVVVPLALAFLFAIVLNPFLRKLESVRVPRVVAIILVLLAFLILVGSIFMYSGYQLSLLMEDLPGIQKKIIGLSQEVINEVEQRFSWIQFNREEWVTKAVERAAPFFTGFLETTSSVLTVAAQIPIYLFLMLLYKDRFKDFLEQLFNTNAQEAGKRIQEVKDVVQGYVLGMFIVICVLAVLNSVGLFLLGIKYALFFGIFSAILTIIPYIGNFIGGMFPFVVALVTKDSAWYAVGVVAVYAFIQFLEGNFITPNIMGSRVSINPLIALLSMIIGGQILGVAGLIIAIPFVGILKLLFTHSRSLHPFVILMEDKRSTN